MLIKIITRDGDIHIIEGVTDVSVKRGTQAYFPYRPQAPDDIATTVLFFEDTNEPGSPLDGSQSQYAVREIGYAKDGPCRLYVCHLAYICNDEGRTIEKVVAGPEVV